MHLGADRFGRKPVVVLTEQPERESFEQENVRSLSSTSRRCLVCKALHRIRTLSKRKRCSSSTNGFVQLKLLREKHR